MEVQQKRNDRRIFNSFPSTAAVFTDNPEIMISMNMHTVNLGILGMATWCKEQMGIIILV